MNWWEKFQDLFKREIPEDETNFDSFFQRLDVDSFFNSLNNLWNPSHLIKKIGGYEKLDILYKDPDIYGAVDKRIAALLDTRLTLEGEDETLLNFFEEQILPHERQLKQDFWWTIANGYGVEQIIYDEDRSGKVTGFKREEFWRFQPLPDLIHVKLVDTTVAGMINKVMPYGKWVLTTNNGTSSNPFGDSMFERLIQPWIFKCNGWDLWMDFAKRFANGFMHAKIENIDQKDAVRMALEAAGKSAILVTDKNSEMNMLQPSRDSSLYTSIDDKTVATIQRVILGETLTSGMLDRGSSGAAEIHNEVRLEKTRADITLVESAINEIIAQIAAVNGFEGRLPYAKIIFDPGLNADLAARDTILGTQGVKFTKDYYIKNYGFEESDFDVVVPPQAQSFFKSEGKSTFLTPEDMKSFLGSPLKHVCNTVKTGSTVARRNTRQLDEKEETVAFLNRNTEPPISTDDLLAAISISKNSKELDENLLKLFDNRNNGFVDSMTDALYYSAAKGAMLGNPERLPSEEE